MKLNWDIRMVDGLQNQKVGSMLSSLYATSRFHYGDHFLRTVHAMTVTHRWSEVIKTDYSQYLFADFWTPVGEEITFEDDMGLSRARLTGFLGMRSPWSAIVVCGTHNGPMRLTVEVHDSPVAQDQATWTQLDSDWSEIIETTFQVRSGKVNFIQLFGEPITEVELLPIGSWHSPRAGTRAMTCGPTCSSTRPNPSRST